MDFTLVVRLDRTASDLIALADRVTRQLEKALTTGDDAFLDAIALNLQGFYTGAEQAFEAIAIHLDGGVPQGPHWHRDLLVQMSCAIEGVRPAVIGAATVQAIDRYRRFRHVVRNVYSVNLEADQVRVLAEEMPRTCACLRDDLRSFVAFLRRLDDVD